MSKIDEIKELKEYLVKTHYTKLRTEQHIDEEYYNDTFAVPMIKTPTPISRTGRGARMVDSPVEHIVTSNPQAFRVPQVRGGVERKVESNGRISVMVNQAWIPHLRRQNPNPFKQSVKDNMLYGESWVHVLHNESWVTKNKSQDGLPVIFINYSPLVVFSDPAEGTDGVPSRVILYYSRAPWIVKQGHPGWNNPEGRQIGESVQWMAYYDSDYRYFEADGQMVFEGENIYGFTPFAHSLSGFGKISPDGEPADLIVGRLRKVRDTLIRECAITSSIDAQIYLTGQPQVDFQTDVGADVAPDMIESYTVGLGKANILPPGVKRVPAVTMPPTTEMFQHLYNTRRELEREDPAVLAGSVVGTSGRQQDAAAESSMRRYDTVVESVENQFSTAFGMALRIIDAIPAFPMPDGLKKDDISGNYEIEIKLKASDPVLDDRKATLGSRLVAQGEIDVKTNLVQYKGYTEDEADQIVTQMLIDKVTLQSPDIAKLLGLRATEKSGMAEDLMMLKMRRQTMEAQQQGLAQQPSPTEQQRRAGEVENPESRTEIDRSLTQRGARQSPVRYTR